MGLSLQIVNKQLKKIALIESFIPSWVQNFAFEKHPNKTPYV